MKVQRYYLLRASALISALLIVAIVSAMASIIMLQTRLNIARTAAVLDRDQALLFATRGDVWAQTTLRQRLKHYLQSHQAEARQWQSPKLEIPHGYVRAQLRAADANLNVNQFINARRLPQFERFLQLAAPSLNHHQRQTISAALMQWLLPKTQAFDQGYLRKNPPYSVAHMPMVTIADVAKLQGMSIKIFKQISPYISALPVNSKLNINAASAQVLVSLNPSISISLAQELIQNRQQHHGFVNISAFTDYPGVKLDTTSAKQLSLISNYFYLDITVYYHQQAWHIRHLLYRQQQRERIVVKQLW